MHALETHELALGCMLLAALGCGGKTTRKGEADSTGPVGEVLWTFGDEQHPLLSDPVVDRHGRIWAMIVDLSLHAGVGADHRERYLVALDSTGRELGRTPVCDPLERLLVLPRALAVGPDDDVWVACADAIERVDFTSGVLWSAPARRLARIPEQLGAISADGWTYWLGSSASSDTFQLHALDGDGVERWVETVGVGGPAAETHWSSPPEIGADGTVYTSCDACIPCHVGLAAFEPKNGGYQLYEPAVPIDAPRDYRAVVGANDEIAMLVTQGWTCCDSACDCGDVTECATPAAFVFDRQQLRPSTAPVRLLIANDSSVAVRISTDSFPSLHFVWDGEVLPLQVGLDRPVALADPERLIVNTQANELVVMDRSLRRLLTLEVPDFTRPLVFDGYLVTRTLGIDGNTAPLAAVRAPVKGLAAGPWPILGANQRFTYSRDTDGP